MIIGKWFDDKASNLASESGDHKGPHFTKIVENPYNMYRLENDYIPINASMLIFKKRLKFDSSLESHMMLVPAYALNGEANLIHPWKVKWCSYLRMH